MPVYVETLKQLSPIFPAQTGLPFTPAVAGNPANTTGAIRSDCIGDGNLSRMVRKLNVLNVRNPSVAEIE